MEDTAHTDLPLMRQANALDLPEAHVSRLRALRPSVLVLAAAPALAALLLVWIARGRLQAVPAVAGIVSVMLLACGARLLDLYLEYARRAHVADSSLRAELLAATTLGAAHFPPALALRAGVVLLVVGTLAGIPMAMAGGPLAAVVGAIGIVLAFLYSATSFAIKRLPISDVVVGLALGPGIVIVMVMGQSARLNTGEVLIGISLGLLAVATLLAAHQADARADRALGRATITIVAGERIARIAYLLCIVVALALIVRASLPVGTAHGALLVFLALPQLVLPFTGMWRARGSTPYRLAFEEQVRAVVLVEIWLVVGLLLNGIVVRVLSAPPFV